MSATSRLRLAAVAAVVLGIWILVLAVASATAIAYPAQYQSSYWFAAGGVALICSAGVLAVACAEK